MQLLITNLLRILLLLTVVSVVGACTSRAPKTVKPGKQPAETPEDEKESPGGVTPPGDTKDPFADDPADDEDDPSDLDPGGVTPGGQDDDPSNGGPSTPGGGNGGGGATDPGTNGGNGPTSTDVNITVEIGGQPVKLQWDGLSHKDMNNKFTISDKKL